MKTAKHSWDGNGPQNFGRRFSAIPKNGNAPEETHLTTNSLKDFNTLQRIRNPIPIRRFTPYHKSLSISSACTATDS